MSTSTIVQRTSITDHFELSPNEAFDVISSNGVTLIENTAIATKYGEVSETLNGSQNISLTYQVGERLHLSRGVYLSFQIPVVVEPGTTFTPGIDGTNYMNTAHSLQDIIFRQHGIISAIDQMTVSFNDMQVSQTSNLSSCFQLTSEYYNGIQVGKTFPCSQPDAFSSYDYYASSAVQVVDTLDEDGNNVMMQIPVISEENIFTGGLSNQYNSRRPVFKFVSATTTAIKLLVKTFMYIPFSFFSTSADASNSLYGINRLSVNITMLNDWVQKMFSIKGTIIKSISFDTTLPSEHKVKMCVTTFEAPDYVVKEMTNSDGGIKPYRLGFNRIMSQPPKTVANVAKLAKDVDVSTDQMNFQTLPRHIYLGLFAKPRGSGSISQTPNFKGRIKSLEVIVNNSQTFIGGDALKIYDLCKGNGLEKSMESAICTNAFVVKLNMAKDVSCAGQLIGSSNPVNIQIRVRFASLDSSLLPRDYELRVATTHPSQLVYKDREFKTYNSLVLSGAPYDFSNQAAALYGRLTPQLVVLGGGVFGDIWSGLKRVGKMGVDWVRNNPDKVAELLGKGIKGILGGSQNVPYQQNIIGAGPTQLLGAGQTKGIPYK